MASLSVLSNFTGDQDSLILDVLTFLCINVYYFFHPGTI